MQKAVTCHSQELAEQQDIIIKLKFEPFACTPLYTYCQNTSIPEPLVINAFHCNIFTEFNGIGGMAGKVFQHYEGTNGNVLHKICVWAGDSRINGIEVQLTDGLKEGKSKTFGKQEGSVKEYIFTHGETITKLLLWGNGIGTHAGWIEFTTSLGNTFSHGMTVWQRKQEYPIDIGSGISCGVFGRSGDGINQLGFVFLRPIKNSRLKNISYPVMGLIQSHTELEYWDTQTFFNESALNQTYHLKIETQVKTRSSWSLTTVLEYSMKTIIQGSIFKLHKMGTNFVWKADVLHCYERQESAIKNKEWNFKVQCPSRMKINSEIMMKKARISIPYKGDMEVELDNGYKFCYKVHGIYEGLDYTDLEVLGVPPINCQQAKDKKEDKKSFNLIRDSKPEIVINGASQVDLDENSQVLLSQLVDRLEQTDKISSTLFQTQHEQEGNPRDVMMVDESSAFKYSSYAIATCPQCQSHKKVKTGHIHNGKERFKCDECGRQFVESPQNRVLTQETKDLIDS